MEAALVDAICVTILELGYEVLCTLIRRMIGKPKGKQDYKQSYSSFGSVNLWMRQGEITFKSEKELSDVHTQRSSSR